MVSCSKCKLEAINAEYLCSDLKEHIWINSDSANESGGVDAALVIRERISARIYQELERIKKSKTK